MRRFLELALTGLVAVRLHRLRSVVSVLALMSVLVPYLAGLAISQGLQSESEAAAVFGADLYVSGSQFGRPAPLPVDAAARVRGIDGVTAVVPRIVGTVVLGKERVEAVLVGLPAEHFPSFTASVEGALPRPGALHELVVGTTLARELGLAVGSTLLPFYRNDKGERLSRVVGVFRADVPLWQANLILTTIETAEVVFDQEGLVTDLLVTCRPGYQAAVSQAIERDLSFGDASGHGTVRPRVTAREDLLALLPRGLLHREGVFNLHFTLAFAVCALVLVVSSGFGLAERRREVGILKATGWQTDEVLLRGLAESLALSLTASCVSLLAAWVWLRLFNGYGIAGVFLAGVGVAPDIPIPFRLTPVPVLLAFAVSLVVVLSGTLYSTWRAATAPPWEAMR